VALLSRRRSPAIVRVVASLRWLLAVLVSLAKNASPGVSAVIGVPAGGTAEPKPMAPRIVTVPGAWPPVSTPSWKLTGAPCAVCVPTSSPTAHTTRAGTAASALQNAGNVPATVPAGSSKITTALGTVSAAPFSTVTL